jgi:hypothetical protein
VSTQTCNVIPAEAERKPKRDGNRTIKRQRRQNTYNVATWNVRSMYGGKLNTVQREMNRMYIEILGIGEMKWIGSGHSRVQITQ